MRMGVQLNAPSALIPAMDTMFITPLNRRHHHWFSMWGRSIERPCADRHPRRRGLYDNHGNPPISTTSTRNRSPAMMVMIVSLLMTLSLPTALLRLAGTLQGRGYIGRRRFIAKP